MVPPVKTTQHPSCETEAGCRVSPLRSAMTIRLSRTWLTGLLLALVSADHCFAERYLTVAEAGKLCFPQSDRVENRIVRFSAGERKAIEKKSSGKVFNLGNRISLTYQGSKLLGVLIVDQVLGKHEIIDYGVALSPDGRVLQVEILEFRESHGADIRNAKWRAQFVGKTSGAPLKLHDDIYNISGATLSCRHVTEGIKRVLATYDLVLRPQFGLAGGLPDLSKAAKP